MSIMSISQNRIFLKKLISFIFQRYIISFIIHKLSIFPVYNNNPLRENMQRKLLNPKIKIVMQRRKFLETAETEESRYYLSYYILDKQFHKSEEICKTLQDQLQDAIESFQEENGPICLKNFILVDWSIHRNGTTFFRSQRKQIQQKTKWKHIKNKKKIFPQTVVIEIFPKQIEVQLKNVQTKQKIKARVSTGDMVQDLVKIAQKTKKYKGFSELYLKVFKNFFPFYLFSYENIQGERQTLNLEYFKKFIQKFPIQAYSESHFLLVLGVNSIKLHQLSSFNVSLPLVFHFNDMERCTKKQEGMMIERIINSMFVDNLFWNWNRSKFEEWKEEQSDEG